MNTSNDYIKHSYAKTKAKTTKSKITKDNDITGHYHYNPNKLEYKPLKKDLKIHSIRLPFSPHVSTLWVNHKNYQVDQCEKTVNQTGLIEFTYNSVTYLINEVVNEHALIEIKDGV